MIMRYAKSIFTVELGIVEKKPVARNMFIFTDRVRSTTGRYCFYRCLSVCRGWGGFTLSPSHNTSTGPMSILGGTSSPSHNTSSGPMSFLGGTSSPSHNTSTGPMSFPGVPQSQTGGTQRLGTSLARLECGCTPGLGTPLARDGVLALQNRTAEGVVATQQAVCLLRSRRRTFLFLHWLNDQEESFQQK